ncbi:MAG: hypothetical protein AAF830_04820 [Pseudomonadota bacterium]
MLTTLMGLGALAISADAPVNLPAASWDATVVVIYDLTEGEIMHKVPAVFPRNADGPGPMFQCLEGRYRMTLALDRPEFRNIIPKRTRRARRVSGQIIVAGEKTFDGAFIFAPETQTVASRERKPAAQVFNAVIRGQDVVFRMRRDNYDLVLPPMNNEFKEFAAACAKLADGDESIWDDPTWAVPDDYRPPR